MAFQGIEIDFATGILTGYNDAGYLGAQVDVFGENSSSAGGIPLMHPFGFAGRPKDIGTDGTGAHMLHFQQGSSEAFALALHDPRVQDRIPVLSKGSSVQYGDWGAFSEFDETTSTWTLYVPNSATATRAHLIQVGEDASGNRVLNLVHSSGLAVLMVEDSAGLNPHLIIKNALGDTYIELNPTGGVLNGNWEITGSLTVGGQQALPVLTGSPPGKPSTSLYAA